MAEGRVWLMAGGFNEWKNFMQQQITRTKDLLSILEVEEQKLSDIWESGAKELWEGGFHEELLRLSECVSGMERLIVKTGEMAWKLAEIENSMIKAAEGIV